MSRTLFSSLMRYSINPLPVKRSVEEERGRKGEGEREGGREREEGGRGREREREGERGGREGEREGVDQ